jgi:hypothetical protein
MVSVAAAGHRAVHRWGGAITRVPHPLPMPVVAHGGRGVCHFTASAWLGGLEGEGCLFGLLLLLLLAVPGVHGRVRRVKPARQIQRVREGRREKRMVGLGEAAVPLALIQVFAGNASWWTLASCLRRNPIRVNPSTPYCHQPILDS